MILATYRQKDISKRMHLTTLTPLGKHGYKGAYNLYAMDSTEKILVIFGNQPELLEHVNANLNNPFLIRLLHKTNNKYSYTVQIDEERSITAITIAGAQAIPIGGKRKCRISLTDKGGVVLE